MRFKDFQAMVLQNATDRRHRWVYRGQSNPSWGLITSYSRFLSHVRSDAPFDLTSYYSMMSRFLLRSSELTGSNHEHRNLFQRMAMSRHHGIPTPILDWSHSPYVATYFAAVETMLVASEAVSFSVFALDIGNLPVKEVACGNETLEQIEGSETFLFVDTKNFIIPRIARQRGCFTFHGFRECLIKKSSGSSRLIRRYDIQDNKRNVVCELQLMGITGGTLFDDLDHVAQDVRSEEADLLLSREER